MQGHTYFVHSDFTTFTHLLPTSLSKSLVIALLLIPLLFGMHVQIRFVRPPPSIASERSLKPTFTPRQTHLSLNLPLVFSVVLDVFILAMDCFGVLTVPSVKERLSAIKVQLELHC